MRYSMARSQGGQAVSKASDLIEEYLSVGGLFNPEIMNQMQHDAVRDTLIIARDEIRGLEKRIKQLEETLEGVTDKLDAAWGIYMQFKEPKP
jgi:capsule polysaccharide export protein KpsE/RkpR